MADHALSPPQRRPGDFSQVAREIVREATGQSDDAECSGMPEAPEILDERRADQPDKPKKGAA